MDSNQNNDNRQPNSDNHDDWKNARDNWDSWQEQQEKKDWDHWNSNASHNSYYNQPTHTPYDQAFSIASVVMGLLSVTLGCCVFSLPLGALGILFALLCYRKGKQLNSNCRLGILLSTIGIVAQLLMFANIFYNMYANPEAYLEQLNQTSQMLYGMDFTELLNR